MSKKSFTLVDGVPFSTAMANVLGLADGYRVALKRKCEEMDVSELVAFKVYLENNGTDNIMNSSLLNIVRELENDFHAANANPLSEWLE